MRTHLVARRQIEVALRWIVAFWGGQGLSFSRVFGETRPPAEFELVFDASPWGQVGVLTTAKVEHSAAVLSPTFDGGRLCSFQCPSGRRQGTTVLGGLVTAESVSNCEPP